MMVFCLLFLGTASIAQSQDLADETHSIYRDMTGYWAYLRNVKVTICENAVIKAERTTKESSKESRAASRCITELSAAMTWLEDKGGTCRTASEGFSTILVTRENNALASKVKNKAASCIASKKEFVNLQARIDKLLDVNRDFVYRQ